jgi:PT repeat-containing protein
MKRGWVRYGALGLGGAVLTGVLLLPATGVLAATPGAGAGGVRVADLNGGDVKGGGVKGGGVKGGGVKGGGGPGKPDPCVPDQKPTGKPTTKPTGEPTGKPTTNPTGKPTGEPTGKPTTNPTGKPTGKPTGTGTGKPVQGALVCGEIAKIGDRDGTTVLTVKTAKGAVTVLVPPDAPVWKGDVQVSRKVLHVGLRVIVKAEVVDRNTFRARAVVVG